MIRNQAKIERNLLAITEQMAERFELGWMKIHVAFDTSQSDDRILCQCFCDFEYRQATLRWNIRQAATSTDDELKETVIHELVHILNAPVWESMTELEQERLYKLNELATENVTRAILAILP